LAAGQSARPCAVSAVPLWMTCVIASAPATWVWPSRSRVRDRSPRGRRRSPGSSRRLFDPRLVIRSSPPWSPMRGPRENRVVSQVFLVTAPHQRGRIGLAGELRCSSPPLFRRRPRRAPLTARDSVEGCSIGDLRESGPPRPHVDHVRAGLGGLPAGQNPRLGAAHTTQPSRRQRGSRSDPRYGRPMPRLAG